MLGRVLEMRRRRVRELVVVADEDDREAARAREGHRLVGVAARGGAFAEPADRHALFLADPEGERAARGDGEHRGQVADHCDQPEAGVGHVHVPVPALRRPVAAPHVLREDPPRLDPASDVDAHVAVQGRADVVLPHRGRDSDRGGLVAAAGVEGAGDLPLAVQDVPALFDAARHEHVPEDAEEILAVEPRLTNLLQRADRLRSRRYRQVLTPASESSWTALKTGPSLQWRDARPGAGTLMGKAADWLREERRKVLGDWAAFCRS